MTKASHKAPPQTSKTCNGCKVEKCASEFYLGGGGRLRGRCIACYSAHNAEQNEKHREKRNAYDKARGNGWDRSGRAKWAVTDAAKHDNYLRRTYGLTLDAYEQMFSIQQCVCAICQRPCNRSTTTRMNVDHDHSNGAVRGLLCFQCNVGLGKFSDKPAYLKRAVAYLEAA